MDDLGGDIGGLEMADSPDISDSPDLTEGPDMGPELDASDMVDGDMGGDMGADLPEPEADLPADLPEWEDAGEGADFPEGDALDGESFDLPEAEELPAEGMDLPQADTPEDAGLDLPEAGDLPGTETELPAAEAAHLDDGAAGAMDLPEGEAPAPGEDLGEAETMDEGARNLAEYADETVREIEGNADLSPGEKAEALRGLRDELEGYAGSDAAEAMDGDDAPMVLTRDEDELRAAGESAIEDGLEVYRDNLRDQGMADGPELEAMVAQERESRLQEFESDAFGHRQNGAAEGAEAPDAPYGEAEAPAGPADLPPAPEQEADLPPAPQPEAELPPDAAAETGQPVEVLEPLEAAADAAGTAEADDAPHGRDETPAAEADDAADTEIDYSEIHQGNDVPTETDYFTDGDRARETLEPFSPQQWEGLSLQEQKDNLENLAAYNADIMGLDPPPEVVYYNNENPADFGGYQQATNTLRINEYTLAGDGPEAADTIAHESRHCYQHQRAMAGGSERDALYQDSFDNYITPDIDFEAYQDQLVERDAREYAQRFKDYISAPGR